MAQTKEDLQRQLRNKKAQLTRNRNARRAYMDEASKVDELYQRLLGDKRIIQGYYNSFKTFSNDKYDLFKGDLNKNIYKANLNTIKQEYKNVISNIDTNLDNLNLKKASLQNQAYQYDGIIGALEKAVNNISTAIQNWVN